MPFQDIRNPASDLVRTLYDQDEDARSPVFQFANGDTGHAGDRHQNAGVSLHYSFDITLPHDIPALIKKELARTLPEGSFDSEYSPVIRT